VLWQLLRKKTKRNANWLVLLAQDALCFILAPSLPLAPSKLTRIFNMADVASPSTPQESKESAVEPADASTSISETHGKHEAAVAVDSKLIGAENVVSCKGKEKVEIPSDDTENNPLPKDKGQSTKLSASSKAKTPMSGKQTAKANGSPMKKVRSALLPSLPAFFNVYSIGCKLQLGCY